MSVEIVAVRRSGTCSCSVAGNTAGQVRMGYWLSNPNRWFVHGGDCLRRLVLRLGHFFYDALTAFVHGLAVAELVGKAKIP